MLAFTCLNPLCQSLPCSSCFTCCRSHSIPSTFQNTSQEFVYFLSEQSCANVQTTRNPSVTGWSGNQTKWSQGCEVAITWCCCSHTTSYVTFTHCKSGSRGIRAWWTNCRGIVVFCEDTFFIATLHVLHKVLPHVCRLSRIFQKEDVFTLLRPCVDATIAAVSLY